MNMIYALSGMVLSALISSGGAFANPQAALQTVVYAVDRNGESKVPGVGVTVMGASGPTFCSPVGDMLRLRADVTATYMGGAGKMIGVGTKAYPGGRDNFDGDGARLNLSPDKFTWYLVHSNGKVLEAWNLGAGKESTVFFKGREPGSVYVRILPGLGGAASIVVEGPLGSMPGKFGLADPRMGCLWMPMEFYEACWKPHVQIANSGAAGCPR